MRYFLAILMISSMAAGNADELPPPAPRTIDFAQDVHPILAEHCWECHGGGKRKGGLQIDSRRMLMQGNSDGPVVIEGDSAGSKLIALVAAPDPDNRMPPEGRALTAEEVGILRAWVDQGLPWTDTAPSEADYVAPLHLQAVDVSGLAEGENLIDHLLAPYFAEHGVDAPAAASDTRFARRAYMDITGLLPTPKELERFTFRSHPDKRTRLIDQLLADDRAYAEHWMTFWNDMLRNDFEGVGYIDGGRKQITDWLYLALRDNMPYDEFTRELILPRPSSEGFINGIVWRGDNAAIQTPPLQAARNLSQVFMGINLKCASCHDSFVDHWQLADAYALANCFSEDPLELIRCDVPLGKPAKYGFLWPELGEVAPDLTKRDRMARIAELATDKENAHFTRTIVNRYWALLMGRGLVEPLDGIEKEPWHPELLDALAQDFIDHGYDLKHLLRQIMTSQIYGAKSIPASEQQAQDYVFHGPAVRRMTAEQFYDALASITGVWQASPKFVMPEDRSPAEELRQEELRKAAAGGKSEAPAEDANSLEARRTPVRAWRVPADPLTRALGRTNREQVTSRRETQFTTLQALELSNGDTLFTHMALGAQALAEDHGADPGALVEYIYEYGLQREPTEEEAQLARAILEAPDTESGLEDLLWAVAMLPEFQLIY